MTDSFVRERSVGELMRQVSMLPAFSEDGRAAALARLESSLREALRSEADRAPKEPAMLLTPQAVREIINQRFIREVIAPELERYWARQRKDPRP